jgi:hypothetical protein
LAFLVGVNGSQNLDRDREQRLMHVKLRQIEQEIQKLVTHNQVEILLLRPLQLNLTSLHGQVEMEMDCSVDLHLNLHQIHIIQGA